ncbi:MAG: TIR domain-containing protein [Eubacterium sp.]|nr:TIR domain-containing protein [Eubacterium sp.]
MTEHFNAFISYKHAPEDNVVAEAVQKGLEHFHIPGKLRKKTGVKRINRIFRDKTELPITNDLSDNISYALENSDYLIVICSTNTKESAWVPREIDAFLKNHTKRDVFTVLVNGDPHDVIPEILQYEERTETDENGVTKTTRIPIEPLSCDYRMPLGKAKKTELPRLVCGIIGCAYDEIINRHRQYRLKQLTAAFSVVLAVMLGFCGYMLYSRNQIHKNYLESLKNQSKYLANESAGLLEKENRIAALQLALEALPKDSDDDRPITAEAVRALTDATLAYVANDGANVNAAWNYQMPNPVSDFQVSDDGQTLAIRDDGSVVGVWNTKTHDRIIYLDDIGAKVVGIRFLDDGKLAVWTDKTIFCYDVGTGNEAWFYTLAADTGNETQSYTMLSDTFKDASNMMVAEGHFYICVSDYKYIDIDSTTGKQKNEIIVAEQKMIDAIRIDHSKLSPDGRKIAFGGFSGSGDINSYVYGVADIGTKSVNMSEVGNGLIKDIAWLGSGEILLASTYIDFTNSTSLGSINIISSDRSEINCVNAADLSEKWSTDFVCNGVKINSGFFMPDDNSVAYYSGNVISEYDAANGTEKESYNVNNSIIDVSDRDGDGNPIYITENGWYAYPAPNNDEDAVRYVEYFTDELRQVIVNNGVYVRQSLSNEVIYYGVSVYDEEWTALDEDTVLHGLPADYLLDESCVALLSDESGPVLDIIRLDGDTSHSRTKLEDGSAYNYRLLGVYNGRVYLGYNNANKYNLISVDLSGNDLKNDELFDVGTPVENACSMYGGKLICFAKNSDNKPVVSVYDIDSGKSNETALPDDIGSIMHVPVYYEEIGAVYVCGKTTDYVVDISSSNVKKAEIPDGWSGACAFSDKTIDGKYAVSDGNTIITIDMEGTVSNTISCPGVTPLGMTYIDGELIVLYNNGGVYRYSANDGSFKGKTDVTQYYNSSGEARFYQDADNNLMYIQMDMLTDVIDLENGEQIAHINNCFGHHGGRDIFITISKSSGDGSMVGYYRRYSVDELINKAHDILKNAELSNEMKLRYGIDG